MDKLTLRSTYEQPESSLGNLNEEPSAWPNSQSRGFRSQPCCSLAVWPQRGARLLWARVLLLSPLLRFSHGAGQRLLLPKCKLIFILQNQHHCVFPRMSCSLGQGLCHAWTMSHCDVRRSGLPSIQRGCNLFLIQQRPLELPDLWSGPLLPEACRSPWLLCLPATPAPTAQAFSGTR